MKGNHNMLNRPLFACALALAPALLWAQSSERIRINQVGYATDQIKIAISLNKGDSASLIDSATSQIVWRGPLASAIRWSDADDTGSLIDFSAFQTPGSYRLQVGSELSHVVHISANPFLEISRGSIKAFWYNRSSYALLAPWAGPWARIAGHPDTAVRVHASAATARRPTNTLIRSPGGWYDAGDYGKYIVNSGISTWTLLHLYESAPNFFDTLSLNVPSHSGPASDLLDEILWNLRWMLSMQDPADGGVYHKLTTAQFSAFIMPDKDKAVRYVVQKSTAATLDLAAVAAYASRLFKNIPELAPLSDSCRTAALSAWAWARANPDSIYNQATLNDNFSPSIGTGDYGDATVSDEFQWAATELFLTTQADSFAVAKSLATSIPSAYSSPSWNSVATLGWIDLLSNPSLLTGSLAGTSTKLNAGLLASMKTIRDYRKSNGYHIPKGGFWWGSNSAFANNGLLLWKAWQVSGDTSYRDASLEALDYLLGRNATGYCFVTGFGSKSPMHIHHRPSAADGVVAPDPGFLVGGPNPGQEDSCTDYPSTRGPKSYVDDQDCYSVNEVAINWSAPLAYLAGVWSAAGTSGEVTGIHSSATSSKLSTQLQLTTQTGTVVTSMAGRSLSQAQLLSLDGRVLSRAEGPSASLSLHAAASGLFVVRVRAMDGTVAAQRIVFP